VAGDAEEGWPQRLARTLTAGAAVCTMGAGTRTLGDCMDSMARMPSVVLQRLLVVVATAGQRRAGGWQHTRSATGSVGRRERGPKRWRGAGGGARGKPQRRGAPAMCPLFDSCMQARRSSIHPSG
jgi:hypothetical protein